MLLGFLAFILVAFMLGQAAKMLWPAYASAAATRSYDLTMLAARLAGGMLALAAAGAAGAARSNGDGRVAAYAAATLLGVSVLWHIRIWASYPTWYHLAWFACHFPAVLAGAKIACKPKPSPRT